jgi:ABC-type transporter Mla subunit MlaD
MPTLDEIIKLSEINLKELNKKIKDLEVLKQDIETTKRDVKKTHEDAAGIPELFDDMFQKIVKLTEKYTNTLGGVTQEYLNGNNILFTQKLTELSDQNKNIKKEVSRLLEVDFGLLFKELQKSFITQTKKDLLVELTKFDDKAENLQLKIEELKKQTDRITKVDLEKYFNKHQNTLAEIFGAINSINITLTNITQTFSGIVQNVGEIQRTLNSNHTDIKQLIARSNTELSNLLNTQNEMLDKKLSAIAEQNELLKKEQKQQKIILFAVCVIVIIGTILRIKH